MENKVSTTKYEEVEIEIPSFYSISCHTFKIISERECIQVCDLVGHQQISIARSSLVFTLGSPKEIAEEMFNQKIKGVYEQIISRA